ncbi:MAG: GNAT family N-acetyltransferase [Cyanobacteria bacterium SBLK]|nr:GNAT family N-acetyltransferase [Cyanobacteria bacterium SBLK]
MSIRQYELTDVEAIATVYRDAILEIGCNFYSPRQVKTWSSFAGNLETFREKLQQGLTLIAVEDEKIIAFGQLHPKDRIAFLYTVKRYARRGYATLIYQKLEEEAIAQGVKYLRTEASRVAKFFFLKQGFEIIEPEIVVRQGTEFERFRMQKKV